MGETKGELTLTRPVDFVRDFLNYVEKVGIFDEFDRDTQKMVTSSGVQSLIKEAQTCLPEKLKPRQAAQRMRDLNDAEREQLIKEAEDGRILDMRKTFQDKMSKNGGAQGIIARLVDALEGEENPNLEEIILDAKALVKGPEHVIRPENDNSAN